MKKFLLATIATYRLITLLSLCLGLFAFPEAGIAQCKPFANTASGLGFTQELVASLPGTGSTSGYGFDSHGNVYTMSFSSQHLLKIDLSTTVPGPGGVGQVYPVIDLGLLTYRTGSRTGQTTYGGNFTQYSDGTVYLNTWTGLGVVQVDLETASITSDPIPGAPGGSWGIGVDPQLNSHGHHNIWYQANGISVIDPVDHRYLGNINIGTDGFAIDPTGNFLFTTGGLTVSKRGVSNSSTPDLPVFNTIGNYGGNPDGMAFATIGTDQVVISNDGGAKTVTMWKFPNNDFTQRPTPTVIASSPYGNEYGDQANVGPDGYFYITYWNGTIFPNCSTSGNASVVRFGPAGRFLPPTHSDNISLTPATDTKTVGTNDVLTATQVTTDLSTNQTVPVANTSVTFTVVGGPDMGQTFTGTTDVNGKLTFTLVNQNGVGDDVVHAQFIDGNHNTQTSNNSVITFVKPVCTTPAFTSCPGNQTANTLSNSCDNTVTYSSSESVTGSPAPTVTYAFTGATSGSGTGNGSGSLFNKGTTTVTLTATNSCGSATCTFTVTVMDVTPPTITCPSNQVLNLDASCNATLPGYRSLVTASDNCTASNALVITQSPAAGTLVNSKGAIIITFTVTDASNNSSTCTITVDKKDVTAPVINCPASITSNNTANVCGAVVTFSKPTATDNCSGSAFNFFNAGEPNNSGGEDYLQLYNSGTWNDLPEGNNNRFIVEINSINTTPIAGYALIGTFGGHTYFFSNASMGWNSARAAAISIGGDLASINTLAEDQFLQSYGGSTWVGGYQDHSDPSYVEPGNASQNFGGWKWVDGTKLGAGQITIVQIAGLASGSTFPVGTTTNTWQATDESSNSSTCSFTVTVNDVQPPVISCPSNISVNATSAAGAVVTYTAPVGTDNCSGATTVLTAGLPSGSTFPIGTTTVTHTVTDGAGLTASCSFNVTVTGLPPVIVCPSNITVNNTAGQCGANVSFAATETTGIPASTITYSVAPGSFFSVGSITVTATATNAVGSSICTFTVTVVDTQFPVLVGVPTDVTVECDGVGVQAAVSATDNCGLAGPVSAYQFPSSTIKAQLNHSFAFENSAADSKGSAVATNVGGISYTQGIIGQAASFNGSGQYFNYGTSASLSGTGPFAISVWTKTSSTGETIVQQRDGGVNGEYMLNIGVNHNSGITNPGKVYVLLYNNGFQFDFFGNKRVDDGTWHHIVFEREGTNGRIFIDGALDATATGPIASLNPSIGTYVGRDVRDGTKTFNGLIDELHIILGTNCPGNYDLERTWAVKDHSGNQTAAQQYVSVKDRTAPVLTVPSDISVSTDPNVCGASVNYVATATDNCSTVTIAYSIAPNTIFSVGTTPVTVTATDACGNTTVKSFIVTVTDTQFPVLVGVPADATVECDAVPAAATVTATDNCTTSVPTFTETRTDGNCANNYTLTRTWSTTDASNNTTTATQVITVQDTKAPVLSAAPDNVTVNCDAVPAAATLTATDNCDATPSVAFAETSTQDANVNSVGHYNYTITRIWTATDACGNTISKTQIITVNDVTPPVITVPANRVLNCQDDNSTSATGVATGTDNCSPVTITYSDASTQAISITDAAHYNYTITRTWTATDVTGNHTSGIQTINVQDVTNPLITVPASVTLNCQDNTSTSATGIATGTDNCSPVTITYSDASTQAISITDAAHYNYTITRTWTATDVTGNHSSGVQTIKVQDITAPVIITCPASVTQCNNLTGNNLSFSLVATDNCSPLTITYTITGPGGIVNGSGATITSGFAVGITTIVWTVKDVSGNTSNCSTTVIINPLPVASYVSTNADAFCNKLTLTASSTINPASYSWTSTNSPGTFSNTAQYSLGQLNGDGNYYVYVKDNTTGCISATAAVYNYQKQNLSSSYTIIAYKEAELGDYNTVASGSVGVLSSKGEAEFGKSSKVASAGSFVKAARIDIDKTATVSQPIYAAATPVLPTMVYNTANTKSLPNYEVKSGTVTLSANYGKLNIRKGAVVTLTGTIYGTIHMEQGTQLTFTQAQVSIDQLQTDNGSQTGYTYVHFAPNSKILVSNSVSLGDRVYLNPENNKVTFYVGSQQDQKKGDDDWSDDGKFSVNGKDVKVTVNVMMPVGKLQVNGGDGGDGGGDDNKKQSTTSINMTGLFVATEVESNGKNVIWNSFDCSAPPVAITSTTTVTQTATEDKVIATSEEELKVTVMPNPSTTYFTLKLESKYQTPVEMRVMDGNGRVIDAKSKIGSNSTIQIGHNYSSGTYYAEMIQGTKRKVVQLIKGKG